MNENENKNAVENEEIVEETVNEAASENTETTVTVEEITDTKATFALNGEVKPPKINKTKLKFGSLSLASTILFIAIVIVINIAVSLLGQRINLKIDLTSEQVFTLDQETIDFLAELTQPVEIIVLGDEASYRSTVSTSGAIAPERYVVETLDNYVRENANITVHYIDPRYNPNFFKERGITLDDGTDTAEDIFLVVYSPETRRYRFVKDTIFDDLQYVGLERRVTAGLLYVTVENIQTIAVVKGHGEETPAYFWESMKDNGFDVKTITLQEFDEIPDYVSILVISNPVKDYSVDDINKIDLWLSNNELLGHHLMVFADLDMTYNKYLEEYLVEWGLSLGTENIFDKSNSYTFTNAYYPLLKVKYSDDAQTLAEDLAKDGYYQFVQLGAARSVNRLFTQKDSRTTYGIIQTFDTAFSRYTASTNLSSTEWKNFTYQDGDTVGPFYVSALSREVRYEGTTQFSSSIYLCGSKSFIDDYFVSNIDGNNQQTAEFMIKLCKFLVSSTQSYDTDILPTQLIFDTLAFEDTYQVVAAFLGLVIGVPVLFIIIGLIVWRKRKFL